MGKNFAPEQLKDKFVVSCQALPDEPLHSSFIMGRMAKAAVLGGADAIRCNSVEDIKEIRRQVDVPLIGLIKAVYPDSPVYITPTLQEVAALAELGVEVIAADATERPRPAGQSLEDFFRAARALYPDQLFMADCSNYEEGMRAAALGFDLIGTTMAGYTPYTAGRPLPDLELVRRLAADCGKPVIAEGGIWSPDEARAARAAGAFAVVVGSAISRPMLIARRFAAALKAPRG